MDAINSVATALNRTIDTCTDYVQENAIPLAVLLAIAYYVRTNGTLRYGDYYSFECWNVSLRIFDPLFSIR